MGFKDYENTISTYIHDDDKLVTYKWLSKELELHVNVAKNLLKEYYESHHRKEKIVATFLLIGQLKDGMLCVKVVKDSNLELEKESFEKLTSEHIYSIQKNLSDIELLAGSEGDLRFSSIQVKDNPEKTISSSPKRKIPEASVKNKSISNHENKEQKSEKEIESKNANSVSSSKKGQKTPIKKQEDDKDKTSEKDLSAAERCNIISKAIEKIKKKPTHSTQQGFTNLFGKVQNQKTSQKDTSKPQNTLADKSEKKPSQETNIKATEKKEISNKSSAGSKDNKNSSSSSKKANSSKSKPSGKDNKDKKGKKISKFIDSDSENSEKSSEEDDVTEIPPPKKRSPKVIKNTVRKTKSSQAKKNENKKHKKVVNSDSEDNMIVDEPDEESNENESENKSVKRARSPSPVRNDGGKRVRKEIDQVYEDEDGYMVSKRVWVSEKVEESEDVKIVEPPKSKKVEIKKIETKKSKSAKQTDKRTQTTLMSFFKKS